MNPGATRARVLLADDHAGILAEAANVLSEEFEIVGSVANGLDLITAAAQFDPDVVVLDITMPGLDGIAAAQQLRRTGCRAKLVFLSVHEDPGYVRGAVDAGGDAFVAKAQLACHLVPAIHEALAGHRFVSPAIPWDETPCSPIRLRPRSIRMSEPENSCQPNPSVEGE